MDNGGHAWIVAGDAEVGEVPLQHSARENFSSVLEEAERDGAVEIRRRDGAVVIKLNNMTPYMTVYRSRKRP
jgi:hypothetical protein